MGEFLELSSDFLLHPNRPPCRFETEAPRSVGLSGRLNTPAPTTGIDLAAGCLIGEGGGGAGRKPIQREVNRRNGRSGVELTTIWARRVDFQTLVPIKGDKLIVTPRGQAARQYRIEFIGFDEFSQLYQLDSTRIE